MKYCMHFGVLGLISCTTTSRIELDTVPVINSVEIAYEGEITSSSTLLCIGTATDEDKDIVDLSYEWTNRAEEQLSDLPMLTLTPEMVRPSDEITCTVYASDGENTVSAQQSIVIENTAPVITQISISPEEVQVDSLLTCSFEATDADLDELSIQYSWLHNEGEVGNESSIQLDAENYSDDDVISCIVTVNDGNEGEESARADVIIGNTAPTITSASLTPETPYSFEAITCNAVDVVDLEEDDVSIQYEWSVNGSAQSEISAVLPPPHLVGSEISCTATPNDGKVDGETKSTTTTIINSKPRVDEISFDSNLVFTNDTITASVILIDEDAEHSTTAHYSWHVVDTGGGDTEVQQGSLPTLDGAQFEKGDQVYVVVTPSDDLEDGESSTSPSLTIANSSPVFDSSASIDQNTNIRVNDTVTCSAGATDPDGDSVSISYQWSVNGQVIGADPQYLVSAADTNVGDSLLCTATATDSDGSTSTSTAEVTIQNTPPVVENVAVSSSSGNNYNDDVLTCSADIQDVDNNIDSTEYAWIMNSTQVGTGSTIDLSTITIMPEDEISCRVHTTDLSSDEAEETEMITLTNRSPVLDAVEISDTVPFANSTLSCSATATDPDGETITPTYEWTNGNVVLGNTPSITLNPADVGVGDTISCSAHASDSYGGSDTNVATATIQNTAPTMTPVSVSPITPYITDTLTCSATGSDLNDGTLDASYSWTNDTTQTELGTQNLLMFDSSTSGPEDSITCTVTYTDLNGASISDSTTVTILNTTPVFDSEADFTPSGPVYIGSELTCSAMASDADDGSATLSYSWKIENTEVATSTTYTVSGSEASIGDTISCTVTASDANNASISSTTTAIIENSPPNITGVTISGGSYNTDTFVCSANVSDPDETVTPTYVWMIGTAEIGTGTSIDLSTTAALPSDELICLVSAQDSNQQSSSETATFTIANRTPSAPTISLTPTAPAAGVDDLTCSITTPSIDADGQTVSYSYEWSKDGTLTSYSTDTIPGSDIGSSEEWTCTVTPDDGIDFGDSVSESVTSAFPCNLTECDTSLDLGGGFGLDMVIIEAGADPVGRYSISNDFYLMTTEVTQGMFVQIMGYESYDGKSTSFGIGSNFPAYYTTWSMAADFANHVTDQHNAINGTSLGRCYSCSNPGTLNAVCTPFGNPYECTGYRLPTEAEWEYSARSGTEHDFWTPAGGGNYNIDDCGNGIDDETAIIEDGSTNPPAITAYAWTCGNRYDSTYNNTSKPVGLKEPNGFGLYDMHGSVYEFLADYFGCSYPNTTTDPYCSSGSQGHIIKGGTWYSTPETLRISFDYPGGVYNSRVQTIGFRLGRNLEE